MKREMRNEILSRLDTMEDVLAMTDSEIKCTYESDRKTIINNQIKSLKALIVSE